MSVTAPSVAIDTNILLYAQGAGDAVRRQLALACLARLPARQLALPVQVLGEFHRVLRRKFQ